MLIANSELTCACMLLTPTPLSAPDIQDAYGLDDQDLCNWILVVFNTMNPNVSLNYWAISLKIVLCFHRLAWFNFV